MKKLTFLLVFVVCIAASLGVSGQVVDDGTPEYRKDVEDSYRKLMIRTSIYEEVPERGTGIRLGIYQAEAAYGEGATEKNLKRLEEAVKTAKGS